MFGYKSKPKLLILSLGATNLFNIQQNNTKNHLNWFSHFDGSWLLFLKTVKCDNFATVWLILMKFGTMDSIKKQVRGYCQSKSNPANCFFAIYD